ncbi:MAG TPA: ketopantoate reductase family protein [Niallia sp.]|nr:ketopantoate reductase family protein [Niallia sp.]
MRKRKKIGIVGLGAIGAVYGKKLQDVEELDVKVIVDENRKERYEAQSFYINDQKTSFRYITPKDQEELDLIIVSVKYGNLQEAIDIISGFVGKETKILSLLNGITSEERIAEQYGKEKVLYSICNGIDSTREGNRIFCSSLGLVSFGERRNKQLIPSVQAIKECFEMAEIPVEVPEDMERTLWYKFMINVGLNQVSAVCGATYQAFQQEGFEKDFVRRAMKEVIQLANEKHIDLSEKDMESFFANVLPKCSPSAKTSMLQDVEAGRQTEVAMFAEQVIKMGKELHIETPVNRELYEKIKQIEWENHQKQELSQA